MSNEKSTQVMKRLLKKFSGLGWEHITEEIFEGVDTTNFGFSDDEALNDREFCAQFLVFINNAIEEATKKIILQSSILHKMRGRHDDITYLLRVILVGKDDADACKK